MPYGHLKGRAMTDKDFEPNFALRLAEKDMRLILEAAVERDLKLPVTEAAARQYRRAMDLGHEDDDLAAVYYAVREPEGTGGNHAAERTDPRRRDRSS
jgi:3-hydroxyisobutyrate dehydrogenase